MCIHMHICVYIYTYICIHICIYVCIYIYIYNYTLSISLGAVAKPSLGARARRRRLARPAASIRNSLSYRCLFSRW